MPDLFSVVYHLHLDGSEIQRGGTFKTGIETYDKKEMPKRISCQSDRTVKIVPLDQGIF